MKNYVQKGENLTLPAPYAVTSGGGVLIGSIFGIAAGNGAPGERIDIVTEGVFTLPKVATDAMTVGQPVYWNDAAKLVTATEAENTRIGVAVATALNPSGMTDVRLNGSF